MVAILDVASGRIVWALSGRWHKQHEAQLVDGNLLLFDNLGMTLPAVHRVQTAPVSPFPSHVTIEAFRRAMWRAFEVSYIDFMAIVAGVFFLGIGHVHSE